MAVPVCSVGVLTDTVGAAVSTLAVAVTAAEVLPTLSLIVNVYR